MLFFSLVVLALLTIMCHSVGCKRNGYRDRAWRRLVVAAHALATIIGIYMAWRSLANGGSNVTALVLGGGVQKLLMIVFDAILYVMYK